jgi:hypothetical protein
MKKNQNSNKQIRPKLILRLEHIVDLSSLQLKGIQGGGSNADSCGAGNCGKPQ